MARSDAEQNRKIILEAFDALIRACPDKLPTMTDIVETSGLGRGTVYRHFSEVGDLVFAQVKDDYLSLYSSYEPEWIDAEPEALRELFKTFLLKTLDLNILHHPQLNSRECLGSEGRRLAKEELRRKIFVTITRLSQRSRAPHEMIRWADVIAHCVETEHIAIGAVTEIDSELPVTIAMGILEDCLRSP